MANGITTGGEVLRSGVGAMVFAAIAALWTRYLERRMRWARTRVARIWSWSILGLVAVGGVIATIVGLFMIVTGTTFGHRT